MNRLIGATAKRNRRGNLNSEKSNAFPGASTSLICTPPYLEIPILSTRDKYNIVESTQGLKK